MFQIIDSYVNLANKFTQVARTTPVVSGLIESAIKPTSTANTYVIRKHYVDIFILMLPEKQQFV